MKKILYTLLFFLLVVPASAQECGIKFFHGTYDEAISLAKKENKLIFIDFYTEWCGPCLNMALTVFTLPQVGDVYNKNFICLKIDAEKGEGRELAKRFKVRSYPTYIFVNPKTDELIHRSGSNKSVKDFLGDVEGALVHKKSSIYLNKVYNSGKFDMNFLEDYIMYKKRSGGRNEVNKLFDDLINMGAKLSDRKVWDIYVECVNGYKNKYVKQISDNYSKFVKLYGKDEVDNKLASASAYAPIDFQNDLCDYKGKYYNIKMKNLSYLFRNKSFQEASKEMDNLFIDPKIDQKEFLRYLTFHIRINPSYDGADLTFDVLAQKVKYLRYIAYNEYNRDDAMVHYRYAVALEYLIQRAYSEGKSIPSFIYDTPLLGKREYSMRHPLLKPKPHRR